MFGYPALDFHESFRITAALRRLPAALARLRALEHRLAGDEAAATNRTGSRDR